MSPFLTTMRLGPFADAESFAVVLLVDLDLGFAAVIVGLVVLGLTVEFDVFDDVFDDVLGVELALATFDDLSAGRVADGRTMATSLSTCGVASGLGEETGLNCSGG